MGASWQSRKRDRQSAPSRADSLDRALQGDVAAARELCRLHGPPLYRTGLLVGPDPERAADAAVTSLVRLLRGEVEWDRRTSLATHLTRQVLALTSSDVTSSASMSAPVPYECLALVMVHGMTSTEVATELGVASGLVAFHLRRDLLALGSA